MFIYACFHYWLYLKGNRARVLQDNWNIAFQASENGMKFNLPAIKHQKEYILFLSCWLRRVESASPKKQVKLLCLLYRLQPEIPVIKMLNHTDKNCNIIALKVLAYLKYKKLEPKLCAAIKDSNPLISLLSARALFEIAPIRSIAHIVDLYLTQNKWLDNEIITILEKVETKKLINLLIYKIELAPAEKIAKLLRLLSNANIETARNESIKLLQKQNNPEIIAASLKYIIRKEDRELLLGYTKHKSWEVRLSAIQSLGCMITPEDINIIALLLSDENWKVRHHAAKSIVSKAFATTKYLDELKFSLVDQNAKRTLSVAKRISHAAA